MFEFNRIDLPPDFDGECDDCLGEDGFEDAFLEPFCEDYLFRPKCRIS